jgi:hypothetical protein
MKHLSDAELDKLAMLHGLYNKHEVIALPVYYTWRARKEQLCLCRCGAVIGAREVDRDGHPYGGSPSYIWDKSVRFSFVATQYLASPEWVRRLMRRYIQLGGLSVNVEGRGRSRSPDLPLSILARPDLCEYIIDKDRYAAYPYIPNAATIAKLEADGLIKSI